MAQRAGLSLWCSMSVNGYLSDVSLPEVFQRLQDGRQTGCLSIQGLVASAQAQLQYFFIWFHRGRIVAVTHRLDGRGLAALISHRRYLRGTMVERLIRRCPPDEPFGWFLRSQGVLTTRQLQILFAAQVICQICGVFQIPDGYFLFDPKAPLPKVEMTGLSVMATEVILPGLRILRNWEAFRDKLPHPHSALVCLIPGRPNIRINQAEWSVWRLMDEKIALSHMAMRLGLSIEEVRRIAFCLMFVGLAVEVPLVVNVPAVDVPAADVPNVNVPNVNVPNVNVPNVNVPDSVFAVDVVEGELLSPSFFRSLIGFLRQMPKSS